MERMVDLICYKWAMHRKGIVLTIINSIIVAIAAMGAYEKIVDSRAKIRNSVTIMPGVMSGFFILYYF